MPAAMMGLELAALHANTARAATDSRGTNWTTLYTQLRDELARQPVTRQRVALGQLFELVSAVDRGRLQAGDIAVNASRLVEQVHPANLAARLAHAVVLPAGEHLDEDTEPIAKFEMFRGMLIEPPTEWKPSLHNREALAAWYEILASRLKRKDVAVAAAIFYEHSEIRSHYDALPIIQRELSRLAAALDARGRAEDADLCRRWFVQLAIGLMRTEPEAGTRLMCADLIARLPGVEPDAAKAMVRLRNDFHVAAAAAPLDQSDPMRSPSVVPHRYRAVVRSMFATASLALACVGGSLLLGLVMVVSAFRAVIGQLSSADTSKRTTALHTGATGIWPRLLILAFVCAGIPGVLFGFHSITYGIFSESWLYVAAMATAAAVAHLVLIVDQRVTGPASGDVAAVKTLRLRVRLAVIALSALVPISLLVLPPDRVAWLIRGLSGSVSGIVLLVLVMLMVLTLAVAVSRVPLRRIATSAILLWCISAVIGLAGLQYHRSTSGEVYQQAVVAGRMDEVATRLGEDWQHRYLKPVSSAYDMDTP